MNKVSLVGRLTRQVELRYSKEGKAIARYTLAINRSHKRDEADFISCLSFGKTAEVVAQYTDKGSLIGVSGEIRTGSYEKDGKRIYTFEVMGNEIELLDSKKSENNQVPFKGEKTIELDDDSLPF